MTAIPFKLPVLAHYEAIKIGSDWRVLVFIEGQRHVFDSATYSQEQAEMLAAALNQKEQKQCKPPPKE